MSLEDFTQKLTVHQSGAMPDGCYQATLKHVVWQEEKRKLRLIGLLDNEREVHQVISRAKPATVEKWNALHGQRVLVQVRRIPRTGQVTGSFRPADGTVVAFGGTRMTDEGEILNADRMKRAARAVKDNDTAAIVEIASEGNEERAVEAATRMRSIDEPARAYHHHSQLLTGLATTRRGLADIAEACYQIQQGKLWTALGYDRLADYLSDPDITLTRREFFRAAAIHEAYVLNAGIEPEVLELAPASKFEAAIPGAIDPSVTADELVSDVQVLGIRDLRQKYRGADEESAPDAPSARCETCGQTLRRAA